MVLTGSTADIFKKPVKLAAARLTGCKNISKARKVSEYEIEALDWGIILKTGERVTEEIHYVGIRAHDIRKSDGAGEENRIPCKPLRIADNPFEKNIIVESNSQELWWKISKAYWSSALNETMPEYISLPENALMLLE